MGKAAISRVLIAATVAVVGLTVHPAAESTPGGADPAAILNSYLERSAPIHPYCALRRLEAEGRGHQGWLEAQTTFSPGSGLRYEITAEGGSGFIRSRVLRSVLEEERQIIARGGLESLAITPANYRFRSEGIDGDGLVRIALAPLRKDRSLVVGRMLLTPREGELLRVEGTLARSPSFWVTRVDIVRSFRRINGVLMPVSLDANAQLRFGGQSMLRMTYQYLVVDEKPVPNPLPGLN